MRQKTLSYAVLTVVILCAGIMAHISARLNRLSDEMRSSANGASARLDRLSDEMRFSAPIDLGHKYEEVRSFMVQSQIAQANDAVIVVGDSITEAALLPGSICGHAVVNAGLGGASTKKYLEFAKQVFPTDLKSVLIIIAIGTNDSFAIAGKWDAAISEPYNQLADFMAQHTEKLLFVGIPPIEMDGALANRYFDSDLSKKNDEAIRQIASNRSVGFVDLRAAIIGEHLTVDGIHLTPAAYRKWIPAIIQEATRILGCTTAQN